MAPEQGLVEMVVTVVLAVAVALLELAVLPQLVKVMRVVQA
jgi:uncharacterized protein with PQ loop repeat